VTDLVVVRKGNSLNKLTIAPGRIEMKLQDDVTPEGEAWFRKFAELVVMDASIHLPEWLAAHSIGEARTMRGRFRRDEHHDRMAISLTIHHDGRRRVVKTYYSDVFGLPSPPVSP